MVSISSVWINPLSLISCLKPIKAKFNNPDNSVSVVSLSIRLVSLDFAYGEQTKKEILEKEGIKFQNRIVEDFEEQRLSF